MMPMKKKTPLTIPTTEALETELSRVRYKRRYRSVLRSTLYTLITVAAVSVLVATLWLPVLQIFGNSMTPTLSSGDVLLCVKTHDLQTEDISVFYHNNRILVKRVIGCAGDQIDLDSDGNVRRNGILLAESYIDAPTAGVTDIAFPCQVPADSFFMMGDHRISSLDSRSSAIGFVPEERILGKAILRIWPFGRICVFA